MSAVAAVSHRRQLLLVPKLQLGNALVLEAPASPGSTPRAAGASPARSFPSGGLGTRTRFCPPTDTPARRGAASLPSACPNGVWARERFTSAVITGAPS